jgi:hypothetical protein
MLADNNYNASALFWYTQRYHAEPRTEDRVPLASGARSDWGLLGVFRSLDGVNRPWGSPRLSGRASLTTAFSISLTNSFGGSFVGYYLYSRINFKLNHATALAEWRQLLSA